MMQSAIVKGRLKVKDRKIDYGKSHRKQLAIPDQSLSIRTIMDRYTRGIPVDVKHRMPFYSDQTEFDLELLSRMEFDDKMSVAHKLRAQFDAIQEAYEARAQQSNEEPKDSAANEPEPAVQEAQKGAQNSPQA